jgi:hypothetical protein
MPLSARSISLDSSAVKYFHKREVDVGSHLLAVISESNLSSLYIDCLVSNMKRKKYSLTCLFDVIVYSSTGEQVVIRVKQLHPNNLWMISSLVWMRSRQVVRASDLTANAEVATVLGSIPACSDTVETEGRQMKQC